MDGDKLEEQKRFVMECRNAEDYIFDVIYAGKPHLLVGYCGYSLCKSLLFISPSSRDVFKEQMNAMMDWIGDKIYEDREDFNADLRNMFVEILRKKRISEE